jgi:hypothetical protein
MVAPSDQALACEACHAPNGRMAELSGFYMPGRGDLGWLMTLGWIAAGVTLVASVVHGLIRLIASGRKG